MRAVLYASGLLWIGHMPTNFVCGMFQEVVASVLLFDDVWSGLSAETKALYCGVKLGQRQIAPGLGVSDI